jgi:histidinol-phosphate aminotransferase
VPSHANFILLPVRDANAVAAELRDKSGIAVRPFTGLPGFGDALRISVGPWDVMERVLAPLAEALGCA